MERLRRRVYEVLEVHPSGDALSRAVTGFLVAVILVNIANGILRTSDVFDERFGEVFRYVGAISVLLFTFEYLLRVWSCTADERFSGAVRGRLRFMTRPMSLVDLLAIAPFYVPFLSADFVFLRLIRLIWLVRLVRHSRFSESLGMVVSVVKSRREELAVTAVIGATLLVISSALMFYIENGAQPEKFSSIPASMWWAVQTLTTVGYGDIVPITPVGKILGGFIAALGIGLFGLPAGILGSGLAEELDRRKARARSDVCPHCGGEISRDDHS